MSNRFKLLIALGSSDTAGEVCHSLEAAGLPPDCEALIFFVADAFLPPAPNPSESEEPLPLCNAVGIRRAHARAARAVEAARGEAVEAGKMLKSVFPGWAIHAEACADSPVWGVVTKACAWPSDLLVVGSRHLKERLPFTSNATQRTIREAPCSIHVARGPRRAKDAPRRLVVGLDASQPSESVLDAVAARSWPPGSGVRLVTPVPPKLKRASRPDPGRLQDAQGAAGEELRRAGLEVSAAVVEGDPKAVLVSEARAAGADYIFMGDRKHGFFQLMHADTALAVAAQAPCSVEIVRC